MADEQTKTVAPTTTPAPAAEAPRRRSFGGGGGGMRGGAHERGRAGDRGGRPGGRGPRAGERRERPKPEFDSKMIDIRRVARVVAGGRRFSFSVAMVIGDKKSKVGVGMGKAGDTALAIEKATRDGKRHMVTIPAEYGNSIPHPLDVKYSSARLTMQPAPGRGLIAGSAVRTVLVLAGRTDVNAKLLSPSKNKLNIARATLQALATLDPKTRK